MEESHLPIEVMAKLLAGKLEHEELLGKVIPHIVSRCPVCRERYEEMKKILKEQGHWDETVALFEGREAPELFQRIAELPAEERMRIVEDDESFHSWGFCQLLLKHSLDAAFEDPTQAVELAGLAVQVSAELGEVYDPGWVLDLRARALAYLGNAHRVLGELQSAEQGVPQGGSMPRPQHDRQYPGARRDPRPQRFTPSCPAAAGGSLGPRRPRTVSLPREF